jgi:hypothetical protein
METETSLQTDSIDTPLEQIQLPRVQPKTLNTLNLYQIGELALDNTPQTWHENAMIDQHRETLLLSNPLTISENPQSQNPDTAQTS